MIHICVSKQTIIGSDNDLLPGWHQAIICTNAGILLIQTLGTNFSEIHTFSFKKCIENIVWRMAAILSWPQYGNFVVSGIHMQYTPNSKIHGAKMGPTWVLSAPGGTHFGPINLAIRVWAYRYLSTKRGLLSTGITQKVDMLLKWITVTVACFYLHDEITKSDDL